VERRCTATTAAGERCKARPMVGRDVCFCHAEPGAWRSANGEGGRATRHRDTGVVDVGRFSLTTSEGITALLAECLGRTAMGQMEPRVSNAVSALANSLRSYLEVRELESRITALEQQT